VAFSILALTIPSVSMEWGQANGGIRLTVKDPSGAVMQASGTLLNLDTRSESSFETNEYGSHEFTGLPYHRYALRVSKKGFVTKTVHVDV
jgi:hypothetical protein